jgi:hypothetical protein
MQQLTGQHQVDSRPGQRQASRAADGGWDALLAGQCRGRGMTLQPDHPQGDPAATGPADRGQRQVSPPGTDVEQRQSGARRDIRQQAAQATPHRPPAAEPAVGPGDVMERFAHLTGVGARIVQQLHPGSQCRRAHG